MVWTKKLSKLTICLQSIELNGVNGALKVTGKWACAFQIFIYREVLLIADDQAVMQTRYLSHTSQVQFHSAMLPTMNFSHVAGISGYAERVFKASFSKKQKMHSGLYGRHISDAIAVCENMQSRARYDDAKMASFVSVHWVGILKKYTLPVLHIFLLKKMLKGGTAKQLYWSFIIRDFNLRWLHPSRSNLFFVWARCFKLIQSPTWTDS